MQSTENLTATQQDQVDQFEHERLAQLNSMTVAELIEEAKGVGITKGVYDSRKAQLVEAIATKNVRAMTAELLKANEDNDAAERGFSSAYTEQRYNRVMESLQREADYDVAGEMCAAIQEHGNVLYQLEWADRWAQAAARKELAQSVIGHAKWYAEPKVEDRDGNVTIDENRRISDPVEALRMARQEVLATPLLENRWRGGSTSAFSNATDAARREAADDLLNRYQFQV